MFREFPRHTKFRELHKKIRELQREFMELNKKFSALHSKSTELNRQLREHHRKFSELHKKFRELHRKFMEVISGNFIKEVHRTTKRTSEHFTLSSRNIRRNSWNFPASSESFTERT